MPTVSSVGMTVSSYFSSLSLLFPFPSPSFPFSLSLFPFFPFSPSPFLSFPLFSSSHFFFPFSSFLFSLFSSFPFSPLLISLFRSPLSSFLRNSIFLFSSFLLLLLPLSPSYPDYRFRGFSRGSPLSHARVRIHYFILLPFFPAPSRVGIIPPFSPSAPPISSPRCPYLPFLCPKATFFASFFKKPPQIFGGMEKSAYLCTRKRERDTPAVQGLWLTLAPRASSAPRDL